MTKKLFPGDNTVILEDNGDLKINGNLLDASKLAGIETGAEVNNISDANATDLTDGGETTLHSHPGGGGYTDEQAQDAIGAMVTGNTETGISVTYDDAGAKLNFDAQTAGDARYAPIAQGVTNGDTHDHAGGDGAQIAYSSLSGLPTLGTIADNAEGDFAIAAKGVTNGDTHDHVGGDGAQIAYSSLSGLPTLGTIADNAEGDFAIAAKGVTNGDTHDHVGGDGAQIAYSGLSGLPTLGTAAAKNIPASGDASATEVVYGTDTRLTNARTPAAHTHPESDVTNLTTDLGNKQATLVSATNIKTVNGSTLLGSGDLVVGTQPDVPITKLNPAGDVTITAGYHGYVADYYEITSTKFLGIEDTSVFEIG